MEEGESETREDVDRETVGDRVVDSRDDAVRLPVGDLDIELLVDVDGLNVFVAPADRVFDTIDDTLLVAPDV